MLRVKIFKILLLLRWVMGVVNDMVTSSGTAGYGGTNSIFENYPELIIVFLLGFIFGILFVFLAKMIYNYIKKPKIRKEITVKKDTEKE